MYSREIVAKRLYAAQKAGLTCNRMPRERSIEIAKNLELLRYDARNTVLPGGGLARDCNDAEQAFIDSERLICKADFEYFVTRYYQVEIDAGVGHGEGIGAVPLMESQEMLLRAIGRREEQIHEEWKKYGQTEGIRVYAHKTRQVMFTSISRALTLHRMIFWPGTRAFAGALTPDGVGELYKRDKLAIDMLPWWLKPELYPDVKDSEVGFPAPLNSRLLYQAENQKTGIGVGTQQDVSHLTEVSLWNFPYQIGFSFAPALPKSRMTLHIQEATSFGKGNYWQEVTEACRRRERGYESWTYVFVPWYINHLKLRAIPTDNWIPTAHTMDHAELIVRTSPEFCEGRTIRPSREQMYWWETERLRFSRDDRLASFLSNFPATPEMSFTNWSQGALPVELIESMELELRDPGVFEMEVAA